MSGSAQTCCSGGVPLSNNLGLPNDGKGSFSLGLSYDYNNLNTLNSGSEKLDDDSRKRITNSVLFNLGYSITDRLSVESLFTWVNQTRTITQFDNKNFTETKGLGESVNGELLDRKADLIPFVETTWATWKTLYPNSKVISTNTGFDRDYGKSPYGDYATNNDFFLFPVDVDPRLPSKQRVLALVDEDRAKVYQHNPDTATEDSFKEKNYLIVNGPTFMVAFEKGRSYDDLSFEYVYDGTSDIVLRDNQNTEWNIFGVAVSGPMEGQKLGEAPYFMAYWFSIPAFFDTSIYGDN